MKERQKKVGIKYCGGCNPAYERVDLVQRVQLHLGGSIQFVRSDQPDSNGVIFVNGCKRCCATVDSDREKPYLAISEEDHFQLLIDWLAAFDGWQRTWRDEQR